VARSVLCTLLPAALLHARLLASIVHWPCRWARAAWPTGGDKVIAQHIAEAMKAKYPAPDCGYFAFIKRMRRTRQRGKTHDHHIAPKSLFPELRDDLANLIPLSVANHKKAHAILARWIPDAAWPCPKFIAAPGSPQWRAANRAAMRKLAASPAWRAANRAAMRKLAATPAWRAAIRKRSANPAWRAVHRAAMRRLSLTGRPLPLRKIISMYQRGTSVRQIAMAIGNPPNRGQNRIVSALVRAGVYRGKR
jgi:hypothetical protein